MNTLQENVIKAAQCSDLLLSDIREAHKASTLENQFAEIILMDLTAQAVEINRKLTQLASL